jgi:hypothetical protein
MKRLRRRLLKVLAWLSLLFCMAIVALGAWSFLVSYAESQCIYLPVTAGVTTADFHPTATQRYTVVELRRGELLMLRSRRAIALNLPAWGWTLSSDFLPTAGNASNRFGFDWTRGTVPVAGFAMIRIVVPLWSLAATFAVLPLWWFLSPHRIAPGLCPSCGYDLRATPDRCPECGMIPAKAENSK